MLKGFIEIDKEYLDTWKQKMPNDVKRCIMREIKRSKTDLSMAAHYQFIYHLLTKYEPLKEIFLASGSSLAEMNEIEQLRTHYLKAVEDERNLLWICLECKKVIGIFSNAIPGVRLREFAQYLACMINSCPSCGHTNSSIMKSTFLLSEAREIPPPKDKDAINKELSWIMLLILSQGDLKTATERSKLTFKLGNFVKDMIKEGKIQYLILSDKTEGDMMFFGKVPPEDNIQNYIRLS